jgi:glutamate decarboxylase
MLSSKVEVERLDRPQQQLTSSYGTRFMTAPVPKYELPERKMPADVAYQIIHDEMNLDGNPALNLASFVTTWMEPEADRLVVETLGKNYIDADEYPMTTEIQNRCVNILARLYNAPLGGEAPGTATVGSSEAVQLAGLALKWSWRRRRQAVGKPADRPNVVMGHNVQVVWEKLARYFDIEPRYVPLTRSRYVLGVPEAMELVDENTIAVVGVLGSTYTGEYEPIRDLNDALDELNGRTGWDVPIHVDAASGGFVAPFTDPGLEWDFRLPWVRSINVSGHKYGLVYPGVGWVLWRQRSDLPEELVFHVNYLGGDQPTFSLNFSKGAAQIVAQYYNFLRLGREGYRDIMIALRDTARWLARAVSRLDRFEVVSKADDLPLVCMRLRDDRRYTVFDVAERLRERGWVVPAYTLAPNAEDIAVLRIVVREGLSHDMAELLVADLGRTIERLEEVHPPAHPSGRRPPRRKHKGVC